MSTTSDFAHIVRSPNLCGGRACIEGHGIPVRDVVVDHEWRGMSPESICRQRPGLTLAEVHSALAYYHDHREAILAEIAEDDRREAIQKRQGVRELPSIRNRSGFSSPPARESKRRRIILFACTIAGLVLLLVGTLLFSRTAGTLRVEINDPLISVQVDGEGATMCHLDGAAMDLQPGAHGLRIKYGDLEFATDKFVLARGEEVKLKVDLINDKIQVRAGDHVIGLTPLRPAAQPDSRDDKGP